MFFSIIVPVYNRERFLARCISSVLAQTFEDFEIVAVDDGSDDGSLARLREFADPRVRILALETNRGVCAARNAGISAARADWLIFLDSDDELVPGALARMNALAAAAPESIHALWFRCLLDDGRISSDPMPAGREWDYLGYLAFLDETTRRSREMIHCVRRSCFRDLRYPDNRMLEGKFHMDFARRFRSRAYDDVLRLYHQDADNRLTKYLKQLDLDRDAAFIRDRAEGYRELLREHGAVVAAAFPNLYAELLQQAAKSATVAGWHFSACCYAARLIGLRPGLAMAWMLLAAGLVGPGAMKLQRHFERLRD